jgi:transposase
LYLKQVYNKTTGRTYLAIAQKYRDPIKKTSTDHTVESLGYLDELEKKYSDPIKHFRDVARKMTEEKNAVKKVTLSFNMDEHLAQGTDDRKNLGYAAIMKLYYEIELDRFFNNKARHEGFQFNTNSIMSLLAVSRILSPGSKKRAFEEKGRYFERFNFSLEDIYHSLSHFSKIAKEAQRYIHEQITLKYGRDMKTIYYDVTNFYFEIDKEDNLRKKGPCKEHRPNPIVQMGLAMDADGIPIAYETFPGNNLDKETFRSVIGEVRRNYGTGRIIVVADKGIITGDNIYYLVGNKPEKPRNGYVFSFSIRGGTDDFKSYVLDESGYVSEKDEDGETIYKIKSRVTARDIIVTMESGKKEKKTVYEKQVVFYSKKYAEREKAERAKSVLRAVEFVKNPVKYEQATSYGAAKYIKDLNVDKKTGELRPGGTTPTFDYEKLAEEEKYDGYYAIVTSELNMGNKEIINTYRGLWEIEETFRIAKGDLETRPIYLQREDRINAHLLSCFISLVIMRLLQKKTGGLYSSEKLIECLNKISCSLEQDNIYLFDYRSEISDTIGSAIGIDFTRKRMLLSDIKKILGEVKK